MKCSAISRVAALGLVAVALPVAALATTVVAVPLDRMTVESEVIVHARVGEQRVTWDEKHRRILTLTTIEVIEAVKGADKGQLLTIYQVGGSLDGYTFKIPGALIFTPGEEMVLFAMRFGEQLVSYGMGLGKYRVEQRGGGKEVVPEYGVAGFVERKPDGSLGPAAPPDIEIRELGAFLDQLRRIQAAGVVKGGGR